MNRLGIYAHYDAEAEVKDFVTFYLAALRQNCQRLIFVSTAPLGEHARARAAAHCDEVLLKDNLGLDFGMWQQVLQDGRLSEYDEVLLTNSSIFGPVYPLEPIFQRMTAGGCDFWAMTENFELEWHLQSYFMVFKRAVLESAAFRDFWSGVLPYRDKFQVIRSYEIGLSVLLAEAGFLGEAAVPAPALFPPEPWDLFFRYKRRNLTCYYPERLLDHGMPFVKAQLLRDNPISIPLEPVKRRLIELGYAERLLEFDRPAGSEGRVDDWFFSRLQRPLGAVVDRLTTGALESA